MTDPCVDYNINHLRERYFEYLNSQAWNRQRMLALKAAHYSCEICGVSVPDESTCYAPIVFDVHHLTYDRLGYEEPDDLQVLCRKCHRGIHNIDG